MNDRVLVAHIITFIESNLTEPLTSESIAERAGYSTSRLRQKFYSVTGDTPSGYLRKRRLTEAAKEILDGSRIADVAARYCYSSQDNFTTSFKSYFGFTPKEASAIEGKYRRFINRLKEAYSIMELANLKQPPLNATLMGCVRGASDFFDYDYSTPFLYGATGHAFLININKEMCPSAPYVWNHSRFDANLERLGIHQSEYLTVTRDTPANERESIEGTLRERMDDGDLCMLTFLEHQLMSGYDEQGFVMAQPWDGRASSEVATISTGSWKECLEKDGWAMISFLSKTAPVGDAVTQAKAGLEFALEMFERPESVAEKSYQAGHGAYEFWIDAVERGMGGAQGSWWCGMVWSECRKQAAEFFTELGDLVGSSTASDSCRRLNGIYDALSSILETAADKELDGRVKIDHFRNAMQFEREAEKEIRSLVSTM